jgi:hypothetical protein
MRATRWRDRGADGSSGTNDLHLNSMAPLRRRCPPADDSAHLNVRPSSTWGCRYTTFIQLDGNCGVALGSARSDNALQGADAPDR